MISNKKLILFTAICVILPFIGFAQKNNSSQINGQRNNARNCIINENFDCAIEKYALLVKDNDNVELNAEYAYALALMQCYDGAIMNLDKVIKHGKANGETLFYIAQVLKLMSYDGVSTVFWTTDVSAPPTWIVDKYQEFSKKYKSLATINTDDLGMALGRAYALNGQKQYIQSLIMYLELVETYPDEYMVYIGFSSYWESLGYRKFAIWYLERGLSLMGNNKSQYDIDGVYQQHLEKLKADNTEENKVFQPDMIRTLGDELKVEKTETTNNNLKLSNKNRFIYLGLTSINKSLMINARYGLCTSKNTSFSIDLGYQNYDNLSIYTGGMSLYTGILGLGVSGQMTDKSFDGGFGVSIGNVNYNNKRSFFDVRFGVYYYMIKAKDLKLTLSVGYTYYF